MTEVIPNPEDAFMAHLTPFPWWIILIQGIVAFILGLFFLFTPFETLFVVVTFIGAYWFISGIFNLIGLAADRSNMGWKIFAGVIGIIAGILILGYPLMATLLLPALFITIIAFLGIILGFIQIFQAFSTKDWGCGLIGILALIIGLLILAKPLVAFEVLPFVLGILGVMFGVAAMIMGFRLKNAAPQAA